MTDIVKRLRASVGMEAYNGDAMERSVCAKQMREAADEIERLRAENAELRAKLKEWGIDGPPPITIDRRKLSNPKTCMPTDKVNLTYVDQYGSELLLSADIGQYITIDTATIFSIRDALGYSSAVLGALGTGIAGEK